MKFWMGVKVSGCLIASLCLVACGKKFNPADGAAPQAQVIENSNAGLVSVDHPEQFAVVSAERMEAPETLSVTGSVNPDISREVPVISLASGRIVDIRTRLGDHVEKGQLLFRVQSPDITNTYNAYLKAVNDERLANTNYLRAKDLYAHGAIPLSALQQSDDAERDAKSDLNAAEEQLSTYGVPKDHPSSIANVYAPISGVIIAQNVTNAAAAGVTYSGTATAFTIANMSVVWIICDVYENDLSKVRLGQSAEIRLSAYPDQVLTGHVSDIGPVLDPTTRTAKVRIEVPNPKGILRLGMFATATLRSRKNNSYATIPSSAILHLHDRDWVFMPAGGEKFKRVEVQTGDALPGGKQQIISGVQPGQQVVANVLSLEAALEAQ